MKIAVICWGSFFSEKGSLKTLGEWRNDGPELPLEFCRISSPGKSKERLSLVLNETSGKCITYWDIIAATDLKTARNNLRDREGAVTDDIHTFIRDQNPLSVSAIQINDWLGLHPEIDAVVWSGVPSNWEKIRHTKFSPEDLVHYLDSKKHSISKIKEGFDKTPPQSKTLGREVFMKCFQKL
ncbi:MAG TPA: hypothetical protein VNJ08_04095 [Bacteriovoracaceae bacterium]|nr:hypothetical protein [Bacteriovoracaceae bacterium]